MPVQIRCPNPACGKSGSIADEFVGKPIRCPHCKTKFAVATPGEAGLSGEKSGERTSGVDTFFGFGPASTLRGPGTLPPGVPAQIGRFQVRSVLGAGAFGTVYRAFDPQLDREVALKVPQASILESPLQAQRFLREAKSAAKLRHPNIVPVYEASQDGTNYFIASAFIEGQTLAQFLEAGAVDFRRAASILGALAEALACAHERGIVHRDVKPANIMMDTKGQPLLMDFGLAHHRQESSAQLTQQGAILGTPAYMAPEQAKGQSGDPLPASDQYSLGIIFYEMLCGQKPFVGSQEVVFYNTIHTSPASPRSRKPSVPVELDRICLKTLSKRPEDRFASCQVLADHLSRWLEGEKSGDSSQRASGTSDRTLGPSQVPAAARAAQAARSSQHIELRSREETGEREDVPEEKLDIDGRDLSRIAGPLGIGVLLLLLLAFTFTWTWFYYSLSDFSVSVTAIGTVGIQGVERQLPDLTFARIGQVHLGLSIIMAIMVLIGYILTTTTSHAHGGNAAKVLFGIVLSTAGWGTINAVWMLGFLWATFRSPLTLPGPGLWFGCALACGIAVLFVSAAAKWRQFVWLLLSQELAAIIGWLELYLDPFLRGSQGQFLLAVFAAINIAFFIQAYLYVAHFSDETEQRVEGLVLLGIQAALAIGSLFLTPWRYLELACVLLMQVYLAIRYPFKALASQEGRTPPGLADYGTLFAVEVLAFTCGFFIGPAPPPPPPQTLDGTWIVESMQVAGKHEPDLKGLVWIINGNSFGKDEKNSGKATGTVKIDMTQDPRTIDVVEDGVSAAGIFDLDGDLLKICFGTQKGTRPNEFSSTVQNRQALVVMRKQKS